MADTITTSANLGIGLEYDEKISVDGKKETRTATITIPNYKSSITEDQVKQAFGNQQVLIGGFDVDNNPITITSDNVVTASTTNQTINNIDIGWDG